MTDDQQQHDDEARSQFARRLFGGTDHAPVEEVPDPTTGNVVPSEGNNPTETPDDLRAFTARLFDRD